jgi:hypothetical protein
MKITAGKYRLLALFLLVLILSLLISDKIRLGARFPSSLGNYNKTGALKIDQKSILPSIDRGETNAFVPVASSSNGVEALLPSGSFDWIQSDYLRIASAVFEFVWKEPLDKWNIYYISFDRECQNNMAGFDMVEIIFFRANGLDYDLREIDINALAGEIVWGTEASFPRPIILGGLKKVNLSAFSITADLALQIAEENGGKEHRLSDNNDCNVLVRMPNSKTDGRWDVSYYMPPLDILINPYTGEYQIVGSQQ